MFGRSAFIQKALDLENFPTPKYDEGQVVYEGVIAEINEALEKVFGIEYCMHQASFSVFNSRQMDQFRQCIEVEDADAYVRCESTSEVAALLSRKTISPPPIVSYKDVGRTNPSEMNPFLFGRILLTTWGIYANQYRCQPGDHRYDASKEQLKALSNMKILAGCFLSQKQ